MDYLVFGKVTDAVSLDPNPEEVEQARWIAKSTLQNWLSSDTRYMTPWFRMISRQLLFQQDLWDKFMHGDLKTVQAPPEIIKLK